MATPKHLIPQTHKTFQSVKQHQAEEEQKKKRRRKRSTPSAQKKVKDFAYSLNLLLDSAVDAEHSLEREINAAKDNSKKEIVLQEALDYFIDFQIILNNLKNETSPVLQLMNIDEQAVSNQSSKRKSAIKNSDMIFLQDGSKFKVRPVGTVKKIQRCWKNEKGRWSTAVVDDPLNYPVLQKNHISATERYVFNVIALDAYDNSLLGSATPGKPVMKVIEVNKNTYMAIQHHSVQELGDKDSFFDIDGLSFVISRNGTGLQSVYDVKVIGKNTLNDKEKKYVKNSLFDLDKEFPPVVNENDLKNQLKIS